MIRPSLRNGFTAYFALSLATGLVCHHRKRKISPANLTPASGRQDHTTSPSAPASFVFRRHRVHHIPLSTFVTMRNAPLIEAGRERYTPDLHFGKTEIFFRKRLDSYFSEVMFDLPDRQNA